MIDLYYWTTPNGHKITIFLEEAGIPYQIRPINISKGDQFRPDYLAISPNNKIPAIVDHDPVDGKGALSLFESGAILWYLAEKSKKFVPQDVRGKALVSEWLFWQVAGLGPMAGQNHHFNKYALEKIPYAINRYVRETARLYTVLNKQLAQREWVAGVYSIADMAIYPWIVPYEDQSQDMNQFPHLERWFNKMKQRPAVIKAYRIAHDINSDIEPMSEAARKILFEDQCSRL